jgi:hypothetical protein
MCETDGINIYRPDKIMKTLEFTGYGTSGAARHKKSRRKKSNADKDIKLRAKVYVKHTVTMYDQHDCCNILQKKVDANASLASAWRRHCTTLNFSLICSSAHPTCSLTVKLRLKFRNSSSSYEILVNKNCLLRCFQWTKRRPVDVGVISESHEHESLHYGTMTYMTT